MILAHPLYLMGGSLAVAWVAARATLAFAAFLGKRAERQFIAAVAMIVLTVGVAVLLKLSVLLTLLAFGALVRNADRDHRLMVVDFGSAGQLFYVILFVVTGASLDLSLLATVGLPALAFVLVRFAGKALGVLLFAAPAGVSLRHASLLALALTPMSGLAVVMVHETSVLYPQLSASVAPVVFAAVAILELAGPIAAQFALKRAGETSPEERA